MRHEVSNEPQVAGVNPNAIGPKHSPDFPHQGCPGCFHAVHPQSAPDIIAGDLVDIYDIAVGPDAHEVDAVRLNLDWPRRIGLHDVALLNACTPCCAVKNRAQDTSAPILKHFSMPVYRFAVTPGEVMQSSPCQLCFFFLGCTPRMLIAINHESRQVDVPATEQPGKEVH